MDYSYDEDFTGSITLVSPEGKTLYLQDESDISSFNKMIESVEDQYLCNGKRKTPSQFELMDEEISYNISLYFELLKLISLPDLKRE